MARTLFGPSCALRVRIFLDLGDDELRAMLLHCSSGVVQLKGTCNLKEAIMRCEIKLLWSRVARCWQRITPPQEDRKSRDRPRKAWSIGIISYSIYQDYK